MSFLTSAVAWGFQLRADTAGTWTATPHDRTQPAHKPATRKYAHSAVVPDDG